MRKVCRLAREVLDAAAREAKPGTTTDQLDKIVHDECIKRDVKFFSSYSVFVNIDTEIDKSYPSCLNYWHFPKSVCTSVNEVICHGIPDQRALQDGDIVNIDVTLYHGGLPTAILNATILCRLSVIESRHCTRCRSSTGTASKKPSSS